MVLTHLVFYSFLKGAGGVPSTFGGTTTFPPFYLFDGFGGVTPTPPIIVVPPSGVRKGGGKRRIVRRADFSSQANYEQAMREAFSDFVLKDPLAIEPDVVKPTPKKAKPTKPAAKPVIVDDDSGLVSLFIRVIESDTAIQLSPVKFAALQKPMSEQELIEMFINIIEDE